MIKKTGPMAGLAAAAIVCSTAAAQAAPEVSPSADTGRLTLYSNPDFSGRTRAITYESCPAPPATTFSPVGSFNNIPAPGCLVTLVGDNGPYKLCAGRGVVPPPYRAVTQVRVVPGTSLPCPR